MKGILKLAPLFRVFRGQVESSEISLEASAKTLAGASNLVVMKIRWLLPGQTREDVGDEEEPGDITGMVGATYVPAMEPWELSEAKEALADLFGKGTRKYPRGATSLMGPPKTVVVTVNPRDLREAMRMVIAKSEPVRRTLVIPKWNFVAHVRSFWSEIRRLSGKGVLLRFSRFLGGDKKEAIQNFLAFLELIRRRRVFARQTGPFSEIVFGTDRESVSGETYTDEEGHEE